VTLTVIRAARGRSLAAKLVGFVSVEEWARSEGSPRRWTVAFRRRGNGHLLRHLVTLGATGMTCSCQARSDVRGRVKCRHIDAVTERLSAAVQHRKGT
jgi:hypothetical protein